MEINQIINTITSSVFIFSVLGFSITSLAFSIHMHKENKKTLDLIEAEEARLRKLEARLKAKAKQLNYVDKAINNRIKK